jgi:hypothetical protein
MTGSLFPVHSFDREVVRWEDFLYELTPVQEVRGVRFKREDYFAPLGYGGINGAKLRQCIWLTGNAVREGATQMVTGASVKSPQLSMGTAVARHYGLPSLLAIGADFHFVNVAYNPALQKAVRELSTKPNTFTLEYGITTDRDDEYVEAFHRLGSEQVRNIPDDIEEVVLPAGSCNSCVSVLYGLARFPPKALQRVRLLGIGPTRLDFIDSRLRRIERVAGVDIRKLFYREFVHHEDVADRQNEEAGAEGEARWSLEHYDLHATHFAHYQDERPFQWGSIAFHPTYEGKVMQYLLTQWRDRFESFWTSGKALFWVIGSVPEPDVMFPAIQKLVDVF